MTDIPTVDDIMAAQDRIAGMAVRTPLLHSPLLSKRLDARVFFKPECLQRTGSFKFRGAWNAVSALGKEAQDRGILAVSSGNHAQGVAEAARLLGAHATIVMPSDAPALKRQRTARSGAEIVTYDRAREDRDAVAAKITEEQGSVFVHPYNNAFVVAGQGTVGLEIAEDCAALGVEPDVVVMPCGGGGLSAGISLAVSDRYHTAELYVAEPQDFDDYTRSLEEGTRLSNTKRAGSLCDALLAREPGPVGWAINRTRLAGGIVTSDDEALNAVGLCFDELRLVVEPGGAAALAALLAGRVEVRDKTVVVVLSGGNIDDDVLTEALDAYRSGAGSRSV